MDLGPELETRLERDRTYLDHVYHQLDAKLVGILSLVGAINQRVDQLHHDLAQLTLKTDHALSTPEEKEARLKKAKELVEKMKKEAEAEIEAALIQRRERGIARDGEALTPQETAAWEAGHELPE